jgi:ribulose-5-phosphate 4-epimerase/fuculose-1-phosphate aldolase
MTAEIKQFSPIKNSSVQVREDLIRAYKLFAHFGMDDLTYTHLSARHPDRPDQFYINSLDLLFEEVNDENLLLIDFDGNILSDNQDHYNATGHQIHSAIYEGRPDINCIMHLHTVAGVAVSAIKEGLLPLSQFSYHFHNNMSYYDYDGLVLDADRGKDIIKGLGDNKAAILRNHGLLTVGSSIAEAFFYMYYLEKSCEVQCEAMAMSQNIVIPSEATRDKAHSEMFNFEKNLGERDWRALMRKLERMSL